MVPIAHWRKLFSFFIAFIHFFVYYYYYYHQQRKIIFCHANKFNVPVRLSYELYYFSERTMFFFSQQINEQYFSVMPFQQSE